MQHLCLSFAWSFKTETQGKEMSLSKSRMKGSGEKKYQTQILGDKLNLKDLPANM